MYVIFSLRNSYLILYNNTVWSRRGHSAHNPDTKPSLCSVSLDPCLLQSAHSLLFTFTITSSYNNMWSPAALTLTLNHASFYTFTIEFISSFQLQTRPISQNITLFRYKMFGCTNSNNSAGAMYLHLHYSNVNFVHLVISNMLYKFSVSQFTLVCF
jgi:hypothetical protein